MGIRSKRKKTNPNLYTNNTHKNKMTKNVKKEGESGHGVVPLYDLQGTILAIFEFKNSPIRKPRVACFVNM